MREKGVKIVSCPTCARTSIDVFSLSQKIEKITSKIQKPLTVAIMGCPVNGLGEGREANLAVIGTGKLALIMKDGEIVKKVPNKKALKALEKELRKY